MCQAQCHHRVSNMIGKKSLVDEQIKRSTLKRSLMCCHEHSISLSVKYTTKLCKIPKK